MADQTTPPGSFVSPILTPPPTDGKPNSSRILNAFKRHRRGYRPCPWLVFHLNPEAYDEALRLLKANTDLGKYVNDRVRYDYDPCRSRLTIRMPTPVHEIFCAKVVREITHQLESIIESGCPESDFAKKINHFASSRVKLPEETEDGGVKYITREPDASFGHDEAQFPGVVIEVCYSQKSRDIRDIADDYILCTDGSINAVATFSIWRPVYRRRNGVEVFEASADVNQLVFRTRDGQSCNTSELRLSLKDFATVDLTKNYPNLSEHEIMISSKQLCEFLQRAESRQATQEKCVGSTNRIPPGVQKRRRPVTPESDTQSEGREAKRGRYDGDDDSEYYPSSSPVRLSD
ncbi:uncharacterized protein BDV17DRAFT_282406 [Aspergillus undulatus]|uniref:uncharacterized protein n=1 Tax=Aspergillus undulatus TaxID=1810928 RepID=UPI003CCE2183